MQQALLKKKQKIKLIFNPKSIPHFKNFSEGV